MRIEQTSIVEYEEVDTHFYIKLPALFQRLQRAALNHSDSVGLDTQTMVAAGAVWILNRIRVRIQRMPEYRESVTVRTWHKGSAGFRAGRDFLVLCGDEQVAAASSQWLYYDIGRKRIAKIPERVSAPYTDEPDEALEAGAIDFAVDKTFEPEEALTITTREGDYDPNGHVNNTVYLDYLDTLVNRSGMIGGGIGEVGIQYLKEIDRDVQAVQGGLVKHNDSIHFRFFKQETVFAAGFVRKTDVL
jgi:medium-chain acyl-[acyl-carrier-protein] hydrolase